MHRNDKIDDLDIKSSKENPKDDTVNKFSKGLNKDTSQIIFKVSNTSTNNIYDTSVDSKSVGHNSFIEEKNNFSILVSNKKIEIESFEFDESVLEYSESVVNAMNESIEEVEEKKMGFCIVNEKPFGNFECKKLPEFKYDFRNRYSIVKREKIDFYENNKNYEKEKSDINHEKEFNNKNNEKEQLYMNQEKEFCNKNFEKEFHNKNHEKEFYNINYEKEQSYINQEKEKSCLNQKKNF